MTASRTFETTAVVGLFLGYLVLWRIKRSHDIRQSGIDPDVLARAATPAQAYFAGLVRFMTALVVAMVVLHGFAPDTWPPLARLRVLDSLHFDLVGIALGATGLACCRLAQVTMGSSWRVGIDTDHRTDLVMGGIYHWIRNPTYLGLHLVNLGLWSIWPTTLVAGYAVLFFIVMDIEVRFEEARLSATHGEAFESYVARTWRYLPWLY